jgi:hypothetical protein
VPHDLKWPFEWRERQRESHIIFKRIPKLEKLNETYRSFYTMPWRKSGKPRFESYCEFPERLHEFMQNKKLFSMRKVAQSRDCA